MNTLIADALFANTTVDPLEVNRYLFNTDFKLLNYGKENDYNHLAMQMLARMERVGMRIRQYIAGATNRIYPTLRQVILFVHAHPDAVCELVPAMVAVIRNDIQKNQWYELMPRFDRIVEVIREFLFGESEYAIARQTL